MQHAGNVFGRSRKRVCRERSGFTSKEERVGGVHFTLTLIRLRTKVPRFHFLVLTLFMNFPELTVMTLNNNCAKLSFEIL